MAEEKWSSFNNGGVLQNTDTLVGLRSGVNTKFNAPTSSPAPASATFAPNGVASGTVFTTFAALATYLATLPQDQQFTIYFDNGTSSFTHIAAGSYTLPPRCRFVGIISPTATSNQVASFTLADVIINGLAQLDIVNILILSNNTSSPVISISGAPFVLNMFDSAINIVGTDKPVFAFTSSSTATISLYGTSRIDTSSANPSMTFDTASFNSSRLYFEDQSLVTVNALTFGSSTNKSISAGTDTTIDNSYNGLISYYGELLNRNPSATFAPNGTASGNVFTSFSALCTYLQTLNQKQEFVIYFDPGVSSNIMTIPDGTYTLPSVVEFSSLPGSVSNVVVILGSSTNVIFNGLRIFTLRLNNGGLFSNNTTVAPITLNNGKLNLNLYDTSITINMNTSKPLIDASNNSIVNIFSYGASSINSNTLPSLKFDSVSMGSSELNIYDIGTLQPGAIDTGGFTSYPVIVASSDSFIDPGYMNITSYGSFNSPRTPCAVFTTTLNSEFQFSDFGMLCEYLSAFKYGQEVTVYFDGTITTLPAGTFTLPENVRFKNTRNTNTITLTTTADTILNGFNILSLDKVSLSSGNTTNPVVTISVGTTFTLNLYDANISSSTGMQPVISSGTIPVGIWCYGETIIGTNDVTAPAISLGGTAGGSSFIQAYDFFNLQAGALVNGSSGFSINSSAESNIAPSYSALNFPVAQGVQVNANFTLVGASAFTIPNSVAGVPQETQTYAANSSSGDITLPTNVTVGQHIRIFAIGNGYNVEIKYPNQTIQGCLNKEVVSSNVQSVKENSTNSFVSQVDPTDLGQFIEFYGAVSGSTGTWLIGANYGWTT